uniref:Beta-defensin n=1 Tax=Jaculus jaculus TaxID=51337 RepID=A0A8C5JVA5_JACJA
MKLLFLLLVIFLAMEPRRVLRCMGDSGVCRSSCKKNEQPYSYCRNNQPCCLKSYMRIKLFGPEEATDSYENHWPKIP